MKSRLIEYVVEALRSPRDSLTRGQHFVRHSIELTVHCWRQLQRHRAEGMAAELTYRTIFSLIPVVVLGLVMFRIFGGLDDVQAQVENQLYSFFGVPEITDGYETPPVEGSTIEASPETVTPSESSAAAENSAPELDSVIPTDDQGIVQPEAAVTTDSTSPSDVDGPVIDMQEAIAASNQAGTESTEAADAAAAAATEAEVNAKSAQQTRATIRSTLHDVTATVSQIDFKSIGVFGLLLFIYAAIALANTTEEVFNRIYDAPGHRPLHLRVAIHWSIITLGSGLLALSLYMSSQVVDWVAEISDVSSARYILNHLLSITASWVLLFLLYALMPNTHVSVRAAAIGSLVGSLLWEGAKFGFQIYVVKAVPYSAIYGSIGLIPLFLFWIYVTWLIILFGLTLTYTLQVLQGGPIGQMDVEEGALPAGDPDWMLPITWEVSHAFESGDTIDDLMLAERLGLPAHVVRQMTNTLSEAGLLRRVQAASGEHGSLTLAKPAEKIQVQEILNLAHRVRPTSHHPAWKTLASLKQAEREAAAGTTLGEVMGSKEDEVRSEEQEVRNEE